jgi:hypothetical protein
MKISTLAHCSLFGELGELYRTDQSDLILPSFVVVRLNDYADDQTMKSIVQLRSIMNIVKEFRNVEPCLNFLTKIQGQRVVMIFSGNHDHGKVYYHENMT